MEHRLDIVQAGQIRGTSFEPTNVGYAIEIEVQGRTIRLEFRDDDAFEFVDRLVEQANTHRDAS